ncbi:uncharacterized protein LOC141711007 [Apium graveolens]|uniref:uncharacterized protein LOC141711007 n=1 Tax=Apium graveolens TaxID=4045 RepID=UPI003D79731E
MSLLCENMNTTMNDVKLANLLASYKPGCHLVVYVKDERYHRFDNFGPEQAIPNAVLSAYHFRMGLSMHLHPFIVKVLERYNISLFQLTSNFYRMTMCIYIIYYTEFDVKLTADKLGYFYHFNPSGKNSSSYYLAGWGIHQGNCIDVNKKDTTVKTPLKGEALIRAKRTLSLSTTLGDGTSLLMDVNLKRCKFFPKGGPTGEADTSHIIEKTIGMYSNIK